MAVIKNMVLSAAMIATVLVSTSPAYAANTLSPNDDYIVSMQEISGYSKEDCLKVASMSIKNISTLIQEGKLTEADLRGLAEDIYRLDVITNYTASDIVIINDILDKADNLVKDMDTKGAEAVKTATSVVRATLGLEKKTITYTKSMNSSGALSFSDVPSGHWAYEGIMNMSQRGLINGTTPPVNGVGTFAPDKTMTRAEFTAIMVRALYPDDLAKATSPVGAAWWQSSYDVAVDKGLLSENEFDRGNMTKDYSRQEMSMLLIRGYEQQGNTVSDLVATSRIADWNSIGTYYQAYVRKAYTLGLLTGVDSKGTFAPQNTLSRAQAATVIYRLLNASSNPAPSTTPQTPSTGTQTFNEGAKHNAPQVGDIVIKADGTQVVLELGIGGILGAGQGVDIYSGWEEIGGCVSNGTNATGKRDLSKVLKDSITGETHTKDEWVTIKSATNPRGVGSYIGEVRNTWFTWNGWCWESTIPLK